MELSLLFHYINNLGVEYKRSDTPVVFNHLTVHDVIYSFELFQIKFLTPLADLWSLKLQNNFFLLARLTRPDVLPAYLCSVFIVMSYFRYKSPHNPPPPPS